MARDTAVLCRIGPRIRSGLSAEVVGGRTFTAGNLASTLEITGDVHRHGIGLGRMAILGGFTTWNWSFGAREITSLRARLVGEDEGHNRVPCGTSGARRRASGEFS